MITEILNPSRERFFLFFFFLIFRRQSEAQLYMYQYTQSYLCDSGGTDLTDISAEIFWSPDITGKSSIYPSKNY